MRVRLGYACLTNALGITSSKLYTYSEYQKDNSLEKLDNIIRINLSNLIEILNYNVRNNIHFYRLSSGLIPLATSSKVYFDYLDKYSDYYKMIGDVIKSNNLRVDFHADFFCVLNSNLDSVFINSMKSLNYYYNVLKYMGVDNKLVVIHIGSSVGGKVKSLERFINNYNKLPKKLKEIIVIENDDKVFNIDDCLYLSRVLNLKVVLDYHHFICNNNGNDIDLSLIFNTWGNLIPKVHFSSSKNKREYRSHHDYIDSNDFIKFISLCKSCDRDIDVMLEAKGKDDALFRLVRELKYKTDYKFMDDTTFIV